MHGFFGTRPGNLTGKPWENDRKTIGKRWFSMGFDGIYPLVMTVTFCELERSTIFDGKSHEISMTIFQFAMFVYKRVDRTVKTHRAFFW